MGSWDEQPNPVSDELHLMHELDQHKERDQQLLLAEQADAELALKNPQGDFAQFYA
jgi:hypothetical protein